MSDFKQRLSDLRFNPLLMQNMVMNELESQLAGQGSYDVPDASNPFAFVLETAVLNSSMNVTEGEALLRYVYPSMAQNADELYRHMSDDDYIGRFATPAWTTFDLYLSKDEVLSKVQTTGIDGVKKLVIPRHTHFTVAETRFTLQYPIEIRQMSHGGLQVVYDTTVTSPIQSLESNMVDWDMVRLDREELIVLRIPVGQFVVNTYTETLNAASGFQTEYGFSDQFYYARVYITDADGKWHEIHTTHSDQVYDPNRITAVLQVLEDRVQVRIPIIYFTQGLGDNEVRVDVYTTKGKLDMDLGSYQSSQFAINMVTIDDDPRYTTPFDGFGRMMVASTQTVSGGSFALTFDELRQRVIDNTLGVSRVPITHAQLETQLQSRGYTMVTNVDNLTNRQFLASRRLSNPNSGQITSAAGCMMGQLQLTMASLVGSPHTQVNGDRMTLLPSMLYEYRDGVLHVVPDHDIQRIRNQLPDAIARSVNSRRLVYSPLHYVLDGTGGNFDVRPYYLDNPSIVRKVFVDENDTAQYQVGTTAYQISRTAQGYQLDIRVGGGAAFRTLENELITVQLSYRPVGENTRAAINGTYVGTENDERVYRFVINTNYDIDHNNTLRITNFSMYDTAQTDFRAQLEDDFDITYIVSGTPRMSYRTGPMDLDVQRHLLSDTFMVVSAERLRIRLGYDLTNLWRRNRSIISQSSYRRHAANVPYVYTETIYKRDANGQLILSQDAEGNIQYEAIQRAGDTAYDADGNPIYRYLKGDVMLDDSGQPMLIAPRQLLREFTLFLLDGKYYFVNDPEALAYRASIPDDLVSWIENDVGMIEDRLLEQSDLYLYPTATFGDTVATIKEALKSNVALDQSFYVNYYLSDTAYTNGDLREALMRTTREIVNEMLGRTTVSVSDIISRLKANGGDDVISIEAGGLGGSNNFSVVSIRDNAVRMSLRKRLTVLSNQLLAVQDDIDINFKRHSIRGQ